ncbi:MAG TPA: M48 family metalloprotease [Candidatus Acidoferrales bacterium]|nr:M48 family metalloprotease [Candidatus Acidoferrales bacterium]
MILSYWLRLVSLCFSAFFIVHAAAGIAVWLAESRAIRFAERITARSAARLLFWIRILPAGIAVACVVGICAPSYLRFEENASGEKVGFACLALALMGALVWAVSFCRGARTVLRSVRFTRLCRRTGRSVRFAGRPAKILVIQSRSPFLVQSGLLQPYIVISAGLLNNFSSGELEAALRHETAHWSSRDNWKRLLVSFLPEVLPVGRGFDLLERGWSKFTERAADDCVSAQGAGSALSLAAALLCLARMQATMGPPLWIPRSVSSLAGSDDLPGRIQRLLSPAPDVPLIRSDYVRRILWGLGAVVATATVAAVASPVLLSSVHELLEHLLR